ncbi:MAG: AAA family ATPase [Afipia sp.]|nr:AAA family ATPase [Afipia sp.]
MYREPQGLDWCVKGAIARNTTSVASGVWGAGKTAVFVDIGLHVAHGVDWRGRKVKRGVVLYVALENAEDVERRVQAWCCRRENDGHPVRDGAFVLVRRACRLFDPSGKPTLDEKKLIEDALRASAECHQPVAMIIIDTLAMSIAPGDDNSAKDASIYTAALKRIADATGANVTTLAHPTKSGEGVRGSGALQANVDTVLEISLDRAKRGVIKAGSKFRIGDPNKVRFGYRLSPVTIGKDEDGDDIDVVLAVEDDARASQSPVVSDDTPIGDTVEDKLVATRRAVELCVMEIAATTGDKPSEIGVAVGQVLARLNLDRKGAGLTVLKERTMVTRLLSKLVEAGEIVKSGDNRRTEYRLSGVA